MDMTQRNINIVHQTLQNSNSDVQVEKNKHMSLRERLFATNLGIVLIGGLLAIGIGVAVIHAEQVSAVEASAATPVAAAETALELPIQLE